MITITAEQKKELNKHVKNIEQIIEKDDINELLLAIDDAILSHIDEDDEPDKIGIEIQRIYDEIYLAN